MTQPDRSRPESPLSASDVSAHLGELAAELIEAGRTNDRERFDRVYAIAFGVAYGEAWRAMGNAATAQRLAARALVRALQLAIERLPRSGSTPRADDMRTAQADLEVALATRVRH